MSNSILVTGAAGLLGRAVVSLLCSSGARVTALVRKSSHNHPLAAEQCVIDLSEGWNPKNLPEKIDVVIHLAQSNRFRDFPEGASDLFGVNVSAMTKLLEYARRAGARQFIYASTGGLYVAKGAKLAENSPIHEPDKLGAYFASKLCGEIIAQSYSGFMAITILRPFFIFGASQKRSMLLPRLYNSVKSGQPIYLSGVEGIRINPIHALDAAEAVIAAISDPTSAIINIAGAEILSIREIAQAFGHYLGRDPVFSVQHGSKPDDLIADISLMRSRLLEPRRSLLHSIGEIAV
jgi:UDP-glucose 4-epimerase